MDIRIVLTLVAITAAAALALFCDYLRTRSLRKRGRLVELRVRRAELDRQANLTQLSSDAPAPAATPTPPERKLELPNPQKDIAAVAIRAPRPIAPEVDMVAAEPRSNSAGPLSFTGEPPEPPMLPRRLRRRIAAPGNALADAPEGSSNQALSNWLIKKAMSRAEEMAAADAVPVSTLAMKAEDNSLPAVVDVPEPPPAALEQPQQSNGAARPRTYEPVIIDERLWASLLSSDPLAPTSRPEPPRLEVPAGFHDSATLSRLIESSRPFSGLVVALGFSTTNSTDSKDWMAEAKDFLTIQMDSSDFACRTSEDEFVLLCPGITGGEAQVKLLTLSDTFWNRQFGVAKSPILFSLGGIDVERQELAQAVSVARERMVQNRNGRNAFATLIPETHKGGY